VNSNSKIARRRVNFIYFIPCFVIQAFSHIPISELVRPIEIQYREKMTTFLQGYEAFITGLGNEGMVFLDQEQHLDQALLSETTIRRNPLTSTKKASI